jgi:hypothetical protein
MEGECRPAAFAPLIFRHVTAERTLADRRVGVYDVARAARHTSSRNAALDSQVARQAPASLIRKPHGSNGVNAVAVLLAPIPLATVGAVVCV